MSACIAAGAGICLLLGVGALIWAEPRFWFFVALAIVAYATLAVMDSRYRARQRELREMESICTFARSFDCRETDTWVIRAVYEEAVVRTRYPVRAADSLTLVGDAEALDDFVDDVAFRCLRSVDAIDCDAAETVQTIGELVTLLSRQPREAQPA